MKKNKKNKTITYELFLKKFNTNTNNNTNKKTNIKKHKQAPIETRTLNTITSTHQLHAVLVYFIEVECVDASVRCDDDVLVC